MELQKSSVKHLLWIALLLSAVKCATDPNAATATATQAEEVNDNSKVNCPDLKCFRSGEPTAKLDNGKGKTHEQLCYRFPDSTR